ncbi:EamA family transporter [Tumebacillus algifaecis]|uniref:EamA family transporter n=1 Tax=Tumebacillus algifaecis TaxID=1214604 RepID=A0A223D0S2_9BACL|nr:EamA family transporter [Tumebacillus algifaecis]ASS75023.1 EamA family transporter [Tumebacillus algifaecis]
MQKLFGAVCLAAAAAIWGGTYVVSKYVLAYVPALTLVVVRFAIAAIVLGLVLRLLGGDKVHRGDWGKLARYGLVGYTISISTQFIGTHLSTAHMGAVITSASPVCIALFAWLLLKERLSGKKIGALLVATLGVLIVIGYDHGSGDGSNLLGNLFLVIAAVTWGLYSVLGKALTERYTPLTVTFWATVFGVLFTLPLSLWEISVEGFTLPLDDPLIVWGILFLAIISTAVAFFLWAKGFELLDAGTAALFFFVQPIFGSFLGWLMLGEQLTASFIIGSVLIFVSVGISMLGDEKKKEAVAT